ncbi:hypothetical protein BVRB_4g076330 isoform B [Beta vulgaris subsp. vulgaris]|uniref:PPM-type phosphatase domain-containing protein n=1 Tax=Beta vulgaris subsp. vulgaris TaxID=3555 RepID=A0A0J8CQI1_BETVV|nr:hypothetical protein BVRB_4g076330 isoform B [Beta vulgaris subsp. vulgaris]
MEESLVVDFSPDFILTCRVRLRISAPVLDVLTKRLDCCLIIKLSEVKRVKMRGESKLGAAALLSLSSICGAEGNLVRTSVYNSHNFFLGFRNYSNCTTDVAVDDSRLLLRSMKQQCKLGFIKIEHVVSLFHDMKSLSPLPSIIDFSQLFTAMCKMKPHPPFSTVISLHRQLLLSCLRPDHYSLNILANCYCRLGHVNFGFSILAYIIKLGYQPDIVTFSTIINGLVQSDHLDQAVELLNKIVKLGFQPDLVVYGTMFKGLCRASNNAGALKLLRNMESHGHYTPNVVIYNTIIDSLCKDKLLPQALSLLAEMKTKGIQPDVVTYSTLIRGMCSLGQWKDAEKLLTEMLGNNITPGVYTYNILIDMYCKEGKVGEARDIFEYMIKRGQVPNIITYNALIDGYCLRGQMDKAERSIGDTNVGEFIVPVPHVKQVKLSDAGGRLVIASDGIWDTLSSDAAAKACRGLPADLAAKLVVKEALRSRGLKDDTTCLVVDIIPSVHPVLPPLPQKKHHGLSGLIFGKKSHNLASKSSKLSAVGAVEELFEEGSAMLEERFAVSLVAQFFSVGFLIMLIIQAVINQSINWKSRLN